MPLSLESAVREEIELLHEFFVGWFAGVLPEIRFERDFERRFDPGFTLIPPAGNVLTLAELKDGLRHAYASNPDFRIAIREVRVRSLSERLVLATYQEWQRNALASTPAENARISTVVLRRSAGLQWLHVHETWLPEDIVSRGAFDF